MVTHCKVLKKREKPVVINFCPKYGGEIPLFWGSITQKHEVGQKGHLLKFAIEIRIPITNVPHDQF